MTHADLLKLLLPPASQDPQGAMVSLQLDAEGKSLDAVLLRAATLLQEADPRYTVEMIADWERVTNLPDDCAPPADIFQERRNAVVARLTNVGGQSPQFYIDLAARFGYDITISESRPFRAGISVAGDELTNEAWLHHWMVRAPETTIFDFKAGQSLAGEPLRKWGAALLECAIGKTKPAHTVVSFAYGI